MTIHTETIGPSPFDQPAFTETLAMDLAVAGLPEPHELSLDEQAITAAIEAGLHPLMQLLDPARTQRERRVATATLLACARYAATHFGAGDIVTPDWYAADEPDRPQGRVLAVTGRTVTVTWANGNTESMGATDLRHDHG